MKQKLKPETWVGIFLIAGILMIAAVPENVRLQLGQFYRWFDEA